MARCWASRCGAPGAGRRFVAQMGTNGTYLKTELCPLGEACCGTERRGDGVISSIAETA